MKVTLSKSVFAVTAILFGLVACADDADPPADTDTADAGATPTSTIPAVPDASKEAKCPSSCSTDSDCENACPPLAGGVQCCNQQTKMCAGSKTATCPVSTGTDDSGTAPPPSY